MHYGMFDFAVNTTVWTIRPKAKFGDVEIGQRRALSAIDIRKINKMYKCPITDTIVSEKTSTIPSAGKSTFVA